MLEVEPSGGRPFHNAPIWTDKLLREIQFARCLSSGQFFEKHALLETVAVIARSISSSFAAKRRMISSGGRAWFRLTDRIGAGSAAGVVASSVPPGRPPARARSSPPREGKPRLTRDGENAGGDSLCAFQFAIHGCNSWPLCSVGSLTQTANSRAPRVCVRTAKAKLQRLNGRGKMRLQTSGLEP